MVSNTIYNNGSLTLTAGVWNIEIQMCFKCTTAGTINSIDWCIAETLNVLENRYTERQLGGTAVLNNFYTKRLTRIVSINTATIYYANFRAVFASGAFQFGNTAGTDPYLLFTAVRIA
jgi:hypothetical protein